METKKKFFKDINRALAFREKVDGEIFVKTQDGYEAQLMIMEYPEGMEEFPIVVVYETTK